MGRDLSRQGSYLGENRAGIDMLRALAGYPTRSVHVGAHSVNTRIVLIQRDESGRVIGTTERIETSEYTDLVGEYLD